MKRAFVLAVSAVLCAAAAVRAQSVSERFPSYIEVAGYAESNVTPDTFYLSITLDESTSRGKVTVEKQKRDMVKALRTLGIDTDSCLTMVDMSGEYYLRRKNTILSAQYRLRVSSAADVRSVFAALDNLGISKIAVRTVTHSRIGELRDSMRLEAMRNARGKAELMAGAVNQTIGSCFWACDYTRDVDETVTYAKYLREQNCVVSADGAGLDDAETLEFKPIRIAGSVNARFVLLDAGGKPVKAE